jgi:two-component system response regulator RegA
MSATSMNAGDSLSLLLVDDDDVFRDRMSRALRDRGHEVITAASYEEALHAAQRKPTTWAILDVRMPGRSGFALARDLRALQPSLQIVILSASVVDDASASSDSATIYLRKPVDADEVLAALSGTKNSNQ